MQVRPAVAAPKVLPKSVGPTAKVLPQGDWVCHFVDPLTRTVSRFSRSWVRFQFIAVGFIDILFIMELHVIYLHGVDFH